MCRLVEYLNWRVKHKKPNEKLQIIYIGNWMDIQVLCNNHHTSTQSDQVAIERIDGQSIQRRYIHFRLHRKKTTLKFNTTSK